MFIVIFQAETLFFSVREMGTVVKERNNRKKSFAKLKFCCFLHHRDSFHFSVVVILHIILVMYAPFTLCSRFNFTILFFGCKVKYIFILVNPLLLADNILAMHAWWK